MTAMPLRLGPLLVCTCVALYRAVWLSTQLSGLDLSELGLAGGDVELELPQAGMNRPFLIGELF